MKSSYPVAAGLLALAAATAFGQTPASIPSLPGVPVARLSAPASEQNLTKFDLDFPGGTPKDLLAAIQEAMRRPLNAIVPDEFTAERLPGLKMKNVNVPQLFEALGLASHKTELAPNAFRGPSPFPGGFGNQVVSTTYGFRTQGPPTDDSIWYFYVERPVLSPPPPPQKICRFYSLAPYVDRGATVDDITTAIETGWQMLGDSSPAAIRFHKDTKLLIAVGEPSKLEIIDAVLKAMDVTKTKPAASAPASATKPPEKPKTEE